MDAGTVIALVGGACAAIGGYVGGKRTSNTSAVETAVGVVELLQVRIETLDDDKKERDLKIAQLLVRVEVLESLVTQKADVEAVADEVSGVRGVVDRIALKMGA